MWLRALQRAKSIIQDFYIGSLWQEPVANIASALLIAARFQPLRPPLQASVDRRFSPQQPVAAKFLEIYRSF